MDGYRLPPELAYLSPVIAHLESIEPEELHEDNFDAIDCIDEALRERVRGLSEGEADRLLRTDRAAFESWLKEHGHRAESAYFINMDIEAEYLLSPPADPPAATLHVFMDSPLGHALEPIDGGLLLKQKGMMAHVSPLDTALLNPRSLMGKLPKNFAGAGTMVDSKVEFGPVRGKKRLHTIDPPDAFKNVSYVLEVPGGWVQVTLQGKPFDEAEFESQFHTLRVEGQSIQGKQGFLSAVKRILGR